MKCPNCVLGDLQLFIRGELRFQTDAQGKPFGTADIHTTGDHFWMRCDTCSAEFGVHGWNQDGAGTVILSELDPSMEEPRADDPQIELERKSPQPGAPRLD